MTRIEVEGRTLAPGQPTLVIAEIGVNHDGKVDRALELVDAAAHCGADAVKLQIFRADVLMNEASIFAEYQQAATHARDPREMLRRYELMPADYWIIVNEIRARGMLPLATPFSPADVDMAELLGLPAIKIASPDLVNWPLLHRAAQSGRPILLSTGAATLEEISASVRWLTHWKSRFALLHCISSYPAPTDQAHLGWIDQLRATFDVPIGYSDHSGEVLAGALAVAAGACLLEKHITLDRNSEGPDHSASFDPPRFAKYVKCVRLADRMRGTGCKHVLAIEEDVRKVSRQSIVAARDLAPGTVIQDGDLMVQRPGTGIPAAEISQVVGRRAARFVRAGEMLTRQALAKAEAA